MQNRDCRVMLRDIRSPWPLCHKRRIREVSERGQGTSDLRLLLLYTNTNWIIAARCKYSPRYAGSASLPHCICNQTNCTAASLDSPVRARWHSLLLYMGAGRSNIVAEFLHRLPWVKCSLSCASSLRFPVQVIRET